MDELNDNIGVIKKISDTFDFPDLHVNVAGYDVTPIGTAAGMDNNAKMLEPNYFLNGFQEIGTVLLKPKTSSSTVHGTQPMRVYVDEMRKNIYIAPELSSEGLEYVLCNIKKYREEERKKPLLASISGIPLKSESINDPLKQAFSEFEQLVSGIEPYANGIVWSPYSPDHALDSELKTPKIFAEYAELLQDKVGNGKLKLVKMDPHEDNPEDRTRWLELVESWMEGGDGIVAVNPCRVAGDAVPAEREKWTYSTARVSGPYLREYRQRAIMYAREKFPEAFIIATGGIDSGEDAWSCFEAGANSIELLTSYYFQGPPLTIKIGNHLIQELHKNGYSTLKEYQKEHFGF